MILFSTFLGFAFALYVLRLTTLPVKNDSNDIFATLYDVFLSALTLGEFFEETTDKVKVDSYKASGGRPWVFKLLFGVYVGVTALILINLLIAMMNNRYKKAKEQACVRLRFENACSGVMSPHWLTQFVYNLSKSLRECLGILVPYTYLKEGRCYLHLQHNEKEGPQCWCGCWEGIRSRLVRCFSCPTLRRKCGECCCRTQCNPSCCCIKICCSGKRNDRGEQGPLKAKKAKRTKLLFDNARKL